MGIFSSKNKAEKKTDTAVAEAKPVIGSTAASVIVRPRITEKAMHAAEKNVYIFEIAPNASKYDVRDAIKEIYGVTPKKVHTVTQSPRLEKSRRLGRTVTRKGAKKAYVYLNEGDTITLA